jgi:hypothetical protein
MPLDLIFMAALRRPIRCRSCDSRFHRFFWEKTMEPDSQA